MKDGEIIYLDYNATTPVDDRVFEAMLPFFKTKYANANSRHLFGLTVNESAEFANEQAAKLIGAKPSEVFYTSGATEAINLALKGISNTKKKHIVTVQTEHKAVIDTCAFLESIGYVITYVNVGKDGLANIEELKNEITDQTLLVSVMYVNNETGIIQPIKQISAIAHERGSLFFCDATQAVGKIPVDVKDLGIDMLAFSAHKFYGPKGIGALYISSKCKGKINAQIHGGGQQLNLRSGTLNVPGIIGLGVAAQIAMDEMATDEVRIKKLRDKLEDSLLALPDVYINTNQVHRIYNTSNICFPGINAEQLIMALGDISVSSGSACTAVTSQPSHVLKAMGMDDLDALSSIRFSLGKFTTSLDIEEALEKLYKIIPQLRHK